MVYNVLDVDFCSDMAQSYGIFENEKDKFFKNYADNINNLS